MNHSPDEIDQLDPKQFILIKNARVNNLKNVSVAIPRNQFVVVSGLSGSGKSSLVFDTLFAEGQRSYVESLNSYARQFLGRMEKPDVDYIRGISPAIAIEQNTNVKNPRSTVGTTTEIYEYLKLLYARVGKTYSPVSGNVVTRHQVTDVVNFILAQKGKKVVITYSVDVREQDVKKALATLLSKGFTRLWVNNEAVLIEDYMPDKKPDKLTIVLDRLVISEEESLYYTLTDSVQSAWYEGRGFCTVYVQEEKEWRQTLFSDKFELDGMTFTEPSAHFFTFNNPIGACKKCEGTGIAFDFDRHAIIPNENLSVYEGVVPMWEKKEWKEWKHKFITLSASQNFPYHRPYNELTEEQKNLLWNGDKDIRGIWDFLKMLEYQVNSITNRVLLSRLKGKTVCNDCRGSRLRADAQYVKINGKSITDIVLMPIEQAHDFFSTLSLTSFEQKVGGRLLTEIQTRLGFLLQVGLPYLTLHRSVTTLSGGEYQRIKLASHLGSALVGSMYILDEPSIGLHPRDIHRMVEALKSLRDLGNTVIVVEHEEEVIRASDQLIDIGPGAGVHGGQVVFQGQVRDGKGKSSPTLYYLSGEMFIPLPRKRREWRNYIEIVGAQENNLKNVTVKIPLQVLTVVTGVSGSGKSTLIKQILYPALARQRYIPVAYAPGRFETLRGSLNTIDYIEFIDQDAIGKTSRSNPVSYVGAYDAIRSLFEKQLLAKTRGFTASAFSYNVSGGRCETCQGEGFITVEMQFMADVHLPCESCNGKRFKPEVLDVRVDEKNIADVLSMTVDESLEFFKKHPTVYDRLKPLKEVGLGYIQLGQSSSTLSGGEAQRVKLASYLTSSSNKIRQRILFIFDEPTTGLHIQDIAVLLQAFQALLNEGHSIIIIEHNLEIIKSADWLIDLGPEGGQAGGRIMFEGTPEEMIKTTGHTAQFLKKKMV